MKKAFSFISLILILICALASKASADDNTGHHKEPQKNLVGEIDKAALLEPPYRSWYTKNHSSYVPDQISVDSLTAMLSGVQVRVFMGTWCHDSQREVPRLFKILESSNFDQKNLTLVSLSLDKSTQNGLEKGLDIQRTPTIIFFKDSTELGRIVETPRDSLENDILKIVSGQEYKHSYRK